MKAPEGVTMTERPVEPGADHVVVDVVLDDPLAHQRALAHAAAELRVLADRVEAGHPEAIAIAMELGNAAHRAAANAAQVGSPNRSARRSAQKRARRA